MVSDNNPSNEPGRSPAHVCSIAASRSAGTSPRAKSTKSAIASRVVRLSNPTSSSVEPAAVEPAAFELDQHLAAE